MRRSSAPALCAAWTELPGRRPVEDELHGRAQVGQRALELRGRRPRGGRDGPPAVAAAAEEVAPRLDPRGLAAERPVRRDPPAGERPAERRLVAVAAQDVVADAQRRPAPGRVGDAGRLDRAVVELDPERGEMAGEDLGRHAQERQAEVERQPLDERADVRVPAQRGRGGRAAVDRSRDAEVARVLGVLLEPAVAAGADDGLVAVAVDDRAVVDDEVLARAVADVAHADVVDPAAVAERALEHRGDTVGVEQRAHRGHGGVRRRRGAPAARDEALLGGEAPERPGDLEQLLRRPLLRHAPGLDHDDVVGVARERHRVRDEDRRAALHERHQAVHDLRLARRVEARGRLVEHEDRRVAQQDARDPDALALAARQPDALRAERAVEAAGQAADEVLGVGRAGGADDVLARRVAAVGDVLGDGAGEQHRVLQEDRRPGRAASRASSRARRGRR